MKRYITILSVLFAAVACSGNIDPEDLGNNPDNGNGSTEIPEEYTAPFTLSVDKSEAEASGEDAVTFSLKDAFDREMLTDRNALQGINITSDKALRVPRMETTVTFIANGEYTFTAKYQGIQSNSVVVKAKNRSAYEVYHRNVGLFKCTSVWCSACPYLGKNLHGLSEETADHTVVLGMHGNFNNTDPFSLYVGSTDLGSYMLSYFGGSGWPTLIYDLNRSVPNGSGSVPTSDLEADILKRRVDSPATCGIKVNKVAFEGTELKVEAAITSSTGGSYTLVCAVLADGLVYQGGYSINDDGVYDEVVVGLSDSFLSYNPNNSETLEAGEEAVKQFSFDFGSNLPSESERKNYYVAVYALRMAGEVSTMDNIVTCDYGKTVDYRLND